MEQLVELFGVLGDTGGSADVSEYLRECLEQGWQR
jgi:hypothetical protein